MTAASGQTYSVIDLGTFPTGTQLSPAAINNAGQVVGSGDINAEVGHGFLWSNGAITDLGSLPGYQAATQQA